MGITKDIDTVMTISGGTECAAALLWAVKKGLKPVAVHLASMADPENVLNAGIEASKKQCEHLGVPLIIDRVDIPQKKKNLFAVYQWQTALLHVIKGNPQCKIKYMVWGANAEDSFRQRIQLRMPNRIMAVDNDDILEAIQVQFHTVLDLPINLFPFEWMTKVELVSLLIRTDKKLYDMIFSCNNPTKDYKACGRCRKCLEKDFSEQMALQAKLRIQESVDYVNSYKD